MKRVRFSYTCAGHRTAITIGRDLAKACATKISKLKPDIVFLVSDSKTRAKATQIAEALPRKLQAHHLSVPRGEAAKSLDHAVRLAEAVLKKGATRSALMVAVGGGALGDLCGFVASVVMRGIRWVHCPTTLLAMVDASVGGKTAINSPRGKNLIGAFHQPEAVVADLTILESLPMTEKRAAMAEVIKIAATSSPKLFRRLESAEDLFDEEVLADAVIASLRLKAKVVEEDEREAGKRRMLNYGHTIGHAIEEWSKHSMRHGEAVGIGICIEARMGVKLGLVPQVTEGRIEALVAKAGLARVMPQGITLRKLEALIATDKKRSGDHVILPFPFRIGAWREKSLTPLEAAELALRC